VKGATWLSLLSEAVTHAVQLAVLYGMIGPWGVDAAGLSAVVSYGVCAAVLFLMNSSLFGVKWNARIWRILAAGLVVIGSAFAVIQRLDGVAEWGLGLLLFLAAAWICVREVASSADVGPSVVSRKIKQWMRRKADA
jgi:hypothetical protein